MVWGNMALLRIAEGNRDAAESLQERARAIWALPQFQARSPGPTGLAHSGIWKLRENYQMPENTEMVSAKDLKFYAKVQRKLGNFQAAEALEAYAREHKLAKRRQ